MPFPMPNRYLVAGLALCLGLVLLSSDWQAFAQVQAQAQDQSHSIPIGAWISAALGWLRDIVISGATTWAGWALTPKLAGFLTSKQVDALLVRAVDYGFATVEGAVKGKTVNVDITNRVLSEAFSYAMANGPSLVSAIGNNIKPRILARISAASPTAVGVSKDTVDPTALVPEHPLAAAPA